MLSFKKMTSLEKKFFLKNLFLIIFGCISLAFGTALFLTKLNIVAGGLSGIAIIPYSVSKDIIISIMDPKAMFPVAVLCLMTGIPAMTDMMMWLPEQGFT